MRIQPKFLQLILFSLTIIAVTFVNADNKLNSIKIEKLMSPQEQKETGISKLTFKEREALNRWLRKYSMTLIQSMSNLGEYNGIGSGHWVSKKSDGGRLITLEDRSLWEIYSIDRIYTTLWLNKTSITVIECDFPVGDYKYYLINTDDGEKALAKYLGK